MTENNLETHDSENVVMTENILKTYDSDNDHEAHDSDIDLKESDISHSLTFHPQPVPENITYFSMRPFLLLGLFCKLLQDVFVTFSKFRNLIPDQTDDSPIGLYCMEHWDTTLKQLHLVMNKHHSKEAIDKDINVIHPAHFGLETSASASKTVHEHDSRFGLERTWSI